MEQGLPNTCGGKKFPAAAGEVPEIRAGRGVSSFSSANSTGEDRCEVLIF